MATGLPSGLRWRESKDEDGRYGFLDDKHGNNECYYEQQAPRVVFARIIRTDKSEVFRTIVAAKRWCEKQRSKGR